MKKINDLNLLIRRVLSLYFKVKTRIWYKMLFGELGKNSIIIKPMKLDNPKDILIGNNVTVNEYSWLFSVRNDLNSPKIIIEDGVQIGHFAHIVSMKKVHIGRNVLIADKVYISDNNHNYENIKIPIMNQGVTFKNEVYIGDGSWIGENVSIVGARIGKHAIIGSNSVVLSDVEDYSIAVGSPARVIKKFCFEKNEWIKV